MIRALLALVLAVCAASPALADEPAAAPEATTDLALFPLETADTRPAGSWSVGVFAPLRYAFSDTLELELHPLLAFVSPSPLVRVTHLKSTGLTLTGEYGLSLPTPGLSLLTGSGPTGGYLFPSGPNAGKLGWVLVPRAGVAATIPIDPRARLTGRADLAVGIPLGGETTVRSLDSFLAPLDLLVAPVLRSYRSHLGVGYDRSLSPGLRLRTTLDAYMIGRQPDGYAQSSQFIYSAHVGLDIKVGAQSRFTVGAIWWNWDQFRTDVRTGANGFAERVRVRSNDFLPTIDFIWAG